MLAFVSDIHLTDETYETIRSGAFQKYALYLKDMAETARAEEVEIVLLGDIFDLIRSAYWERSNIRPWSKPSDEDAEGKRLRDYTDSILDKICVKNKQSIMHLKNFKEEMTKQGVSVKITYMIGNHDWLINRYPETRTRVARFLGIENPEEYREKKFATERIWEDYRVFARHGDIYDPFNFAGDRDESSLGDAIVIELANKFAEEIQREIGPTTDPGLINALAHIADVRPVIDTPLFLHAACRRANLPQAEKQVKKVWNRLADKFLETQFVKEHDTWWPFETVDGLKAALKISKVVPFKHIVSNPVRMLLGYRGDYKKKALKEECMSNKSADFIVYGHTHYHQVEPLDVVTIDDVSGPRFLERVYINTGTWRRVYDKTLAKKNQGFLMRHIMTFIAIYKEPERMSYRFEIWNGELGGSF